MHRKFSFRSLISLSSLHHPGAAWATISSSSLTWGGLYALSVEPDVPAGRWIGSPQASTSPEGCWVGWWTGLPQSSTAPEDRWTGSPQASSSRSCTTSSSTSPFSPCRPSDSISSLSCRLLHSRLQVDAFTLPGFDAMPFEVYSCRYLQLSAVLLQFCSTAQ